MQTAILMFAFLAFFIPQPYAVPTIIYKLWNYEVAPDLYKSPHMKAKAEFFLKLVEKDFKMTDADKEAWKKAFKAIS